MSVYFGGGPLDGQVGGPPLGEPPADPSAMGGAEEPMESEGEAFKRLLADMRLLLSRETVSEKSKLLMSKAETLLQQVAANEEADDQAAMGGKLTAGVMRKLGGAGGGF